MIDDPKQLRELARWFSTAARNASDPRSRSEMAARAQELLQKASEFSRARGSRIVVNLPTG